jgi:hypothetical protein
MWNKRIIAAAIAALGVAGPLTSAVRAQSDDMRREDRREDQREVRLIDLPRNAAGALDLDRLLAEIRALFQQGVRDVRIREEGLTAQERQQLAQFAANLAGQLNLERVRIRDENNRLRIDLRNEREARNERDERREARREDRREDRVERREDRREDRVERREDRRENLQRPERAERNERPEHAERNERAERPERAERVERPERVERAERPERPERSGRGGG